MLRLLVIGFGVLFLATLAGYSASMAGSTKMLGGGSAAVSQLQCELTTSEVVVSSSAINTVKVTVNCPETRTYTVEATVANSSGTTTIEQSTLSLTAGSPTVGVSATAQTWYDMTSRVMLP